MNRRTRHLVVLLVAVVTAAVASFGVYRAMGQHARREAGSSADGRRRGQRARCRSAAS